MVAHDVVRDELLDHLGDAAEAQPLQLWRAAYLDELGAAVAASRYGICRVQK